MRNLYIVAINGNAVPLVENRSTGEHELQLHKTMPSVRPDPIARIELSACALLLAVKGEADVRPRNTGAFAEPFPTAPRNREARSTNQKGISVKVAGGKAGLPPTS